MLVAWFFLSFLKVYNKPYHSHLGLLEAAWYTWVGESRVLILLLCGAEGFETRDNQERHLVDVRDVAQALLLVYEKAEAEGRYICTSHTVKEEIVVEKLKSFYPHYNYPKK